MEAHARRDGAADRRRLERWFIGRGVPQLVEGYGTEPAMDARAAPVISLWLILGAVLFWGTRPDWSAATNAAGVVGTILWMAAVWLIANHLRGRPFGRRPRTLDLIDITTIGLSPAIPAGLVHGSLPEAITATLGALAGIGVIYVLVGFGVFEILVWAAGRLWAQLAGIVELMTSTLPLLLILVAFLLFAAELWQAAHAMDAMELAAVLLLLLAVAALLVVTTVRREFARLVESLDPETIETAVRQSTAAGLVSASRGPAQPRHVPLTLVQRANLSLLVTFQQLLQTVVVAMLVMAFLVLLGTIAIPPSVQERWIEAPVDVIATADILGEERTVSAELLTVTALLGGIVGLYFSGLALTDPTYRASQFDRTMNDVREILAVRAAYHATIESSRAADEPEPALTPGPGLG